MRVPSWLPCRIARLRSRLIRNVQPFLKVFIDIVLWRRGPQDLPSSMLLVLGTLVAYVLVSVMQLALMHESRPAYVVFLVADPLLLMGWIWLVLKVYGRVDRYAQTIAAILGSSALISLVLSLPLQLLVGVEAARPATPAAQILGLGLILVFVLVAGRIVKLATDSNLFTGICVNAIYVLVLNAIAARLLTPGS
jgi:hypothetical protein